VEERGKGWGASVRVRLTAHGEQVEIGSHLMDEKRAALARELRAALKGAQA